MCRALHITFQSQSVCWCADLKICGRIRLGSSVVANSLRPYGARNSFSDRHCYAFQTRSCNVSSCRGLLFYFLSPTPMAELKREKPTKEIVSNC